MRKTILLILLFVCTNISFGQTTITNFISDNHISVEGTKVSMIPPIGFDAATNFAGFLEDESGSSIMVLDIPGPFSEVSKGFTKEGLQTQGMELVELEEMSFNSLPAVLIKAEQNAYGTMYVKYVLAFGSEQESILVNGTYPKTAANMDELMKKSLLSAFYNASIVINPFDVVDFEVSTGDTDFVFTKTMSNSLLFTKDGQVPSTSPDKASLIVVKAFSEVAVVDKKAFCEERIQQLPFQIETINSTEAIEIDAMKGFEIIADAKNKTTSEPSKVYQVILFTDTLYYIILGSTEGDFETNLSDFKSITKTFKRK